MKDHARLQRRVQRYGWDLAASRYDALWQAQLSDAHRRLLALAPAAAGESVLDVACGTGVMALAAAEAVGTSGRVVGVDIAERMVGEANAQARARGLHHARFLRMDGEALDTSGVGFDLAYCALGLMYMPDPDQAMRGIHGALRPGGRVAVAVWGQRARCGWSPVFPIVDEEVASDVCPLFFQLGHEGMLTELCARAGFVDAEEHRVEAVLAYADDEEACDAAFVGGPVAMAWSRFDETTRRRVRARYLQAIQPWRIGQGYRMPGEFVVATARTRAALSATG
ncbi:class I SAM-dependent methyltransferase [Pseudoxanthomonas sp. LjRoot125]|uniref:class I SAM-dependent methyltransferase n=1 Tax=Pseudoxanthomonas sp. LjRoot125 TaxID=3342258 RepID=UPI003E118070